MSLKVAAGGAVEPLVFLLAVEVVSMRWRPVLEQQRLNHRPQDRPTPVAGVVLVAVLVAVLGAVLVAAVV
jgi:hypothetical protein